MKFRGIEYIQPESPQQAVALQREMRGLVQVTPLPGPARFLAGVDAAFSRCGTTCYAAAVLWDLETGSVIETTHGSAPVTMPYIPGLLSFREAPALLAALSRLERQPDVLLCDGQGIAHPRRFGIACHIGLVTGLPALGCAKSRLVGRHRTPGPRRGSRAALMDASERIGTVLRTRDGVKPLYVSVGSGLTLPEAERLALRSATRYRLPEPTRLADRQVAAFKKALAGLADQSSVR